MPNEPIVADEVEALRFGLPVGQWLMAPGYAQKLIRDLYAKLSTAEEESARRIEEAVAAEREACALICETQFAGELDRGDHSAEYRDGYSYGGDITASHLARAIRARSNTGGSSGE